MSFAIGDYVEVIDVRNRAAWGHIIGMRGIVLAVDGTFKAFGTGEVRHDGVRTTILGTLRGHHAPENLRKIDPPDWSAPLTTEKEKEHT